MGILQAQKITITAVMRLTNKATTPHKSIMPNTNLIVNKKPLLGVVDLMFPSTQVVFAFAVLC